MNVSLSLLFLIFLYPVAGLILPLTKQNGDPDMNSIINHVTLMEQSMQQSITSLQTQVQTTNSELSTVKGLLQRTQDELVAVKTDLKTAEADIAVLKHDLQKSPDPVEFALLKSEVEALKISHGPVVHQANLTVLDSISSDVKSNIGEIQALKSQIQSTDTHVETNKADITGLTLQVKDTMRSINTTDTDVHSIQTRLPALEAGYSSVRSRQNNTEQDLAVTRALVQTAAAELKEVKSRVNTITSVQGRKVAFQVTQRGPDFTTTTAALTFNTVDTNIGAGYDNASGTFTAPLSGTYIFWANIVFYNGASGFQKFYISKGQQKLATGWTHLDATHGQDSRVASVLTVNHLDIGDQIQFNKDTPTTGIIKENRRACKKAETCIGKLTKNCVRPGQKGRRPPRVQKDMCSDVAFQVTQRDRGITASATRLTFNTVDTNIGGGYDKVSGNFTAPVSGTYMLWANIVFYETKPGLRQVSIYKGGQMLAAGWTKLQAAPDPPDFRVASTMTVSHLDMGDQIHFNIKQTIANVHIDFESNYGGTLLHVD